ncbi:MAG: hypothetical protein JO258_13150 [Alphaproteobacteria bacterium]|nr:hypothetical protein [Alphaproteobacteria bacterium]
MRDDRGPRCEQVIRRYEGRMAGPPRAPGPMTMGPGMPPMAPGMAPGGQLMPYAYVQPEYVTPGYMVPPLMWVRVPIIHEQRDCGCRDEVIEERVVTSTVEHRPARHRRVVHDKYEKYSR